MALKDILEQIKKENQKKLNEIKKEHDEKIKALDKEFADLEKEAMKETDEQVKTNSEKIVNKMTTVAKMEAKNKLLSEKRELMEKVFEDALDELVKSKDYKKLLVALLKHSDVKGDDITVIPAKNKMHETKAALEESGKPYKLAAKTADIKGGFILSSGKVEIDNSFESILFKQLRDDLELEIAKTIFPK